MMKTIPKFNSDQEARMFRHTLSVGFKPLNSQGNFSEQRLNDNLPFRKEQRSLYRHPEKPLIPAQQLHRDF